MRKVTLLIVVLLTFGLVGAFGQDDGMTTTSGSTFELTGEATATFGADLDEEVTGFSNSFDNDLEWTFVEEATEEKGEGTVYGWIELEDFEATVDKDGLSVTPPDISAKLMLGPAYIDITDHEADVDKASNFSKVAYDVIDTVPGPFSGTPGYAATPPNVQLEDLTENAGVAVGFEAGMVTAELGIASEYDWKGSAGNDEDATERNLDNAYVLTAMADVTPIDPLTVGLKSAMWFGRGGNQPVEPENPASVGLDVAYDYALSEDLTLTPETGVDLTFEEDGDGNMATNIEAGLGVNLLWPGLGVDESDEDIFEAEDVEVTSGVGLGTTLASYHVDPDNDYRHNVVGVKLGFYEDGGDEGLLPIVGGSAVVNYNSYLENDDLNVEQFNQFGMALEADADLGVVTPFAGFITGSTQLSDADAFGTTYTAEDVGFSMNVGTDINVISNTTFTVEYQSGDLTRDEADTYDEEEYTRNAGVNSGSTQSKLGTLSVSTTIEY